MTSAPTDSDVSARRLLADLAGRMNFTTGRIRLHAAFVDGILTRPMRVSTFRVPAGGVDALRYEPPEIDGVQPILEEVARQLGAGVQEIVAEYALDHRGADLQWIDVTWAV